MLCLLILGCSSNNVNYSYELYPWLLNGKSKTEKYNPVKEAWIQRKCRGCKYDPSLWL